MIGDLPIEIQLKLLSLAPRSSLKSVNSHFYVLYNDLYYQKIVKVFGESIINVLIKTSPWLITYMKSLDVIRNHLRDLIASKLKLPMPNDENNAVTENVLHFQYLADSWKYIYSLLKNKRLFAEYSDYKIDEPTNYVFNHFVEINRTYLLSYSKTLWLSPGKYNLNIGLVIKHGNGLGTTKFEVSYGDEKNPIRQSFFAPRNINEILPKKQFCFLKLGEFEINPVYKTNIGNPLNKLIKVNLIMEEIGLYLKSGFRIFFIDVSQPSTLFNDYDLLYYTVKEIDYRYFINIPLKNFYKALNYVQNGGSEDDGDAREKKRKLSIDVEHYEEEENLKNKEDYYGSGDPNEIESYETELSIAEVVESNNEVNDLDENNKQIKAYGKFYFLNRFGKRYFKFNTVYQRRQFINRFGDFELDWNDDNVKGNGDKKKACNYDLDGLKWKMPILGEL